MSTLSYNATGAAQQARELHVPALVADRIATRIFAKDHTLWGPDAEAESSIRLGWVDLGRTSRPLLGEIAALREQLSTAGLTRIVLCGMGGAYLSIAQGAGYINSMTAGKGFIALAALIFAKWKPGPALAACLLFGFLDAIAIRLQGVVLPGIGQVPVQAIQALPYVLTVVLLAGFIGRAIPPKASGLPYVKER